MGAYEKVLRKYFRLVGQLWLERVEEELQKFADGLSAWLHGVLEHPTPRWRESLDEFLAGQKAEGRLLKPESRHAILGYLYAWAGTAKPHASAAAGAKVKPRVRRRRPGLPDHSKDLAPPPTKWKRWSGHHRQQSAHEVFFLNKLARAERHLNEMRGILEALGQKLDAAPLEEEVDVDAEADAIEALILQFNDSIESAQDAWLRYDLSHEAMSRLESMATPASLGLPMHFDADQSSRLNHQRLQIIARKAGRNTTMDRVVIGATVVKWIGFAAGVFAGVGVVANVFREGGKWAVVKTVGIAAAVAVAEQGVEYGLRAAGANETVIRGARLAAAIVSIIILRRRSGLPAPKRPPEPLPKGSSAPQTKPPPAANIGRPPVPSASRKNPSGNLEDAARAARTQPYGPVRTPSVTRELQVSEIPKAYINTKYQIDMSNAPAGSRTNVGGHARNAGWFWRRMLRNRPELFSAANKENIRLRRAPIVDDTWIQHNPMHQSFKGDILVHHHIDQGKFASALPETIHRKWHSALHATRGGN